MPTYVAFGKRLFDFVGLCVSDQAEGQEDAWLDQDPASRSCFARTNVGDVTSLFEHFSDTSVGEKKAASSYRTISEQIGLPPHHILFLSDAERELDAAVLTGFKTAHIVRPGTDAGTRHPTHPDLTCLLIEV